MAINPHKPLRLTDLTNEVTLVGMMPNGDIVVHVKDWAIPAVFDPQTGKGRTGWASYQLENTPEVKSAFYWWDTFGPSIRGRGMIAVEFIWADYPGAKYCLEIISTDGIPTDAKIHERKPA